MVSFLTTKDEPWAEEGYEIGWDEFVLGKLGASDDKAVRQGIDIETLQVIEKDGNLSVSTSNNITFVINLKDATIESVDYGYGNILISPLKVNYWRALTDNDKGYANFAPKFEKLLVDYSWKRATYGYKVKEYRVDKRNEFVKISFDLQHSNFSKNMVEYKIYGDGEIVVSNLIIPKRDMVRLGFQTQLKEGFSSFSWYGKGPHENYIDRNYGAKTSVHNMDISEIYHLYMRPQENGNRTEVRWLRVKGKDDKGFKITDHSGQLLNFSAWPFSLQELERAKHIHELPIGDFITLNIDLKQRGVGGDLPGMAALHDEFKIHKYKEYEVTFSMVPEGRGEDNGY